MDPYRVIRKPHVSEKSHEYTEMHNTYVFEVDPEATKTDIRNAVETLWGVQVKQVRTTNMPGKLRRYRQGRSMGRSSAIKKAIVRLAEGQAIEALR